MNSIIRGLAEEVYKILSFSFDVEIFDKQGNRVYNGNDARNFYVKPGKILITLIQKNDRYELTVNLSKNINIAVFEKKIGKKLRNIVSKNGNVKYNIRTYGREIKLKDFAEQLSSNGENVMTSQNIHEGMYGTTRSSYQKVGECKVIIRHVGRVNEEKFGSRSRHISAIFVETKAGERFKLAENNLHGARALARHLSNGGSPFDTVGTKITEMIGEMAQLKKMIKETKSHIKETPDSTQAIALQEQIKTKFISLRETLKRMGGSYGYKGIISTLTEDEYLIEYQPAGQYQSLKTPEKWSNKDAWFNAVMSFIEGKLKANRIRKPEKQITKSDALSMLNLSDADRDLFLNMASKHSMKGESVIKEKKRPMSFIPSFPDKFSEVIWKMADALDNPGRYDDNLAEFFKGKSPELPGTTEEGDQNFNKWASIVERLNDQYLPLPTKLTSEEKNYILRTAMPFLKIDISNEISEEKRTVSSKERSLEKVAGDQIQDMVDFARDNDVSSGDLFSVNNELKENVVLESWFNTISNVEFFNEEELIISEDTPPTIEKTLPHNALYYLTLNIESPLFEELVNIYQKQGIIDEIISLVENDSKIYSVIIETKNRLDEFHKGSELSDAFAMMDDYMSQRRMGADEAIEKSARYYADEYHNGDERAFEQAKESLKQMAQGAGLIHHDVGRTFADDVLSSDDEIRVNKDAIRAEEYYGDANFKESDVDENKDKSSGCKDPEQLNGEASGPYVGEENEDELEEHKGSYDDDYDDDDYDDDNDEQRRRKRRDVSRKGNRRRKERGRTEHMDEKPKHDLGDIINTNEVARIIELSKYRT